MAWLPNPFKSLPPHGEEEPLSDVGDDATGGSVKEDLSVIGETIGRQLRGVAEFLAPPPPASSSSELSCSSSSAAVTDDTSNSMSPTFARIRSDVAELGGSFKSSLSLLSNNTVVAEFSKMASNFLHLDEVDEEEEDEEQDDRGVGITDAVLQFVTEISKRPECWIDFPLLLNQDFIMSPAQAEHVAVIVDLVPSLAELRDRLSEMAADRFWMIYFILLLPRLNRDSVDLLSTPEIVETRSALLNMLLNKRNSPATRSQKHHSDNSSQSDSKVGQDRHDPNSSREKAAMVDNIETSIDVEGMNGIRLEEEDATANSFHSHLQFKNVDDVSFSDLEDDDTDLSTRRYGSGRAQNGSSPDASSEWVQLNKNVETGGGKSKIN